MKKIVIFLMLVAVALGTTNAAAGDFSLQGYIEAGFYPPGNEFNPPGTRGLVRVARYALRAKIRAKYKRIFINYEPKLYLGDNRPGQCGCSEQSYNAPTLVYYQRIDFGFQVSKEMYIYIETARTFWPRPSLADGDPYMYNGIYVRYTF